MANTMTLFDYGLVAAAIAIAGMCAWFLLADSMVNTPRNSRTDRLLRSDTTTCKK